MTLLEALEIVLYLSTWDCYNDEPHEWSKEETEAYQMLIKALTEYEELKRDVKRYFELDERYFALDGKGFQPECNELFNLKQKLSKVGNDE